MHAHTEWPERLRAAMTRAGYRTTADLAHASGLSHSMIGRWLSGVAAPTIESLRAISGPLGVPLLNLVIWAGILSPEEAGADTSAVRMPTAEEVIEADQTLTEDGRRAALVSLHSLRQVFSVMPRERRPSN